MEPLVETAPTAYRLVKADADTVQLAWGSFIRPGILEIKRHDRKSGNWTPSHVRQHIEAGFRGQIFCECHLIVRDACDPVGFVMLKMYPDEFIGAAQTLWVWLAYCKEPSRVVFPCVLPQIEQRAKELGMEYVEGLSSRDGWAVILADHGYEAHQTSYRKALYPEVKKHVRRR